MSQATWNLLALILAGIGSLLGIVGTLMIANGYYPGSIGSFLVSLPGMLFFTITNNRNQLAITEKLAREDRQLTLMGVLVIFVGFLIQFLGAAAAFLDCRQAAG